MKNSDFELWLDYHKTNGINQYTIEQIKEIRACEFAMHLLIPTDALLKMFGGNFDFFYTLNLQEKNSLVKELAKRFKVEESIMCVKIDELIGLNRLKEILMADDVLESINDNTEYLFNIIPELSYIRGFEHKHPQHHLDVYEHTLYAISLSEKDFDVRLALLLHDLGKPFSYIEGDIRHFKGHPAKSAKIAERILTRLGFDCKYIKEICYLVKYHDTPINDLQIENNYSLTEKLYEVQRCDALAHHPDKLESRKKYLKRVKEKFDKYKK